MGNIGFNEIIFGILVFSGAFLIYFFILGKTKPTKSNLQNEAVTIESLNEKAQIRDVDLPDDSLIAILTAAVMASMQNNPDIKIRVTSFRRINQSSPIWNTTGRRERIENKLYFFFPLLILNSLIAFSPKTMLFWQSSIFISINLFKSCPGLPHG